jgi:4-amino-4-deoxy-L-arabinose transferase-like glycosyltransferase
MNARSLNPVALAIGVVAAAVLLMLAGGYGFHRDELYFIVAGQHPDWGYVDQPPLTPLLSAAAVAILGVTPVAIRILPAIIVAVCVVLAGQMATDMGGRRRAGALAALILAISGLIGAGHLDSTTTFDILFWTTATWLVVGLARGADPRRWLLVGLAFGVGLQNKDTILLLGIGLVVGFAFDRRWEVFRSPWAWAGVALAVAIWLPNLAWQAGHGFPQLTMGQQIGGGEENRTMLLPLQLLLAGPFLWPVAAAGLWQLVRSPRLRPWRPLATAYVVVLAILFATGGKGYYSAGMFAVLIAAGSIALDGWLSRGRRPLCIGTFAVAATLSGAFIAIVMLPILPARTMGATFIPDLYKETAEQVGWPELVATVEQVASGLTPAERSRAIVVTANYGQAGAVDLLGGDAMPPVYSGHNSYADWGPPPEDRDVILLVGFWDMTWRGRIGGQCEHAARISNEADVENDEWGAGVWICRGQTGTWQDRWALIRHLD